jgi:hypothetical protein
MSVFLSILTDIIGNHEGAKLGAAHGAEVRTIGGVSVQSVVVEGTGRDGVQGQVKLVVPTEFETSGALDRAMSRSWAPAGYCLAKSVA